MNKLLLFFSIMILSFAQSCFAATQSCSEASSVCVDNSPYKYFNGVAITMAQAGVSCWKYDKTYNCPLVDECKQWIDQGCVVDIAKSVCTEKDGAGKCKSWTKEVVCSSGSQNTMIACGNDICKPAADGSQTTCYKADPTTDTDFGSAMAALEMANEMGTMKNCYDKTTGLKCQMSDPNDPSKGVNANCECRFFQGKFITYKDSWILWGGGCAAGNTATFCGRVADEASNNGRQSSNARQALKTNNNMLAAAAPLPQRNIDVWSDKGQVNSSLTGDKNNTGIRGGGNQYVYSFASSNKGFDDSGQNVTGTTDQWAATNQQNSNLQIAASSSNQIIDQDNPNAQNNTIHWNNGGSQTAQGSTAKTDGTMKVVGDAMKMVGDVMDFTSAFSQACSPEDSQKMIQVGKHHCLFDYGGVPGPETNQWVLYSYGDKERWDFQHCGSQMTFWGSTTACSSGSQNYNLCQANPACLFDPSQCSSDYCYRQHLGGAGGQACGGITGGNDVIWKGNVNCCFTSTISKIINKAAFEQHVGNRGSLSVWRYWVALYKNLEVCTVQDLATGLCNPTNTGMPTEASAQARCEEGITLNDMQAIDFAKVDFSEFYEEANRGINTSNYNPSVQTNANQQNRVTDSIGQKKQDANQVQSTQQLQGRNYFSF